MNRNRRRYWNRGLEGLSELESSAHSPPCIPQGVAAPKKRPRSLVAQTGWLTTPAAPAKVASRYFLGSRPPLLAVMQGGECAHDSRFAHTLQPSIPIAPTIPIHSQL